MWVLLQILAESIKVNFGMLWNFVYSAKRWILAKIGNLPLMHFLILMLKALMKMQNVSEFEEKWNIHIVIYSKVME